MIEFNIDKDLLDEFADTIKRIKANLVVINERSKLSKKKQVLYLEEKAGVPIA